MNCLSWPAQQKVENPENWKKLLDELNSRPLVVGKDKDSLPIDLSALAKGIGSVNNPCLEQSLIIQPSPAEPIISDTGTSVIQNEPEPAPAYRATFSSEGSMAYLTGGGELKTIIVPD